MRNLDPLNKTERLEILRRMRALNVIGNLGKDYERWPELVEYVGYCHLLLSNIYPKYIEPFKRKGKKKKVSQKKRSAPKREAFQRWVKDFKIDPQLSLDRLLLDVEDAYQRGDISEKIGRDTISKCLVNIRANQKQK